MVGHIAGTRLQLEQDDAFQRRDWIAQRIAWVVFALVLLAALLGFFGSGPLSTASTSADGARIEYERFARNGRPMTLTVIVEEIAASTVTIAISEEYLTASPLERTVPEASEESAAEGLRRFEFRAQPGGEGCFIFYFQPRSVGRVKGTIAVNDGTPAAFATFFYP